MKNIICIILLISVAFAAGAADVTVLSISGTVEIKTPGGAWLPAEVGQVVSNRSMISTGFGSRAQLSAGGMELNLKPLTRVSLDSLTQDGDVARTEVSLQSGIIRATRPPVTRTTRSAIDFRVSTPVATAAVRGTDFTQSPNKLLTHEGMVKYTQGLRGVFTPGGTFTWSVPGYQPSDPAGMAAEIWSVSPVAGSVAGEDTGAGKSDVKNNTGWAQITLQ